MSVAVLAPGPSLPRVWCDDFFDDYGCVIATNSAGWRYLHHWVVGFDPHIFTPVLERRHGFRVPLVGVRSSKPYVERAIKQGLQGQLCPWHCSGAVPPPIQARTGSERCMYSFPNALHFALTRWSGKVDVYGMDYAIGAKDFLGVKGDRGLKRFRQEAAWLRVMWEPERITVYGDASVDLLDYLSGKRDTWL